MSKKYVKLSIGIVVLIGLFAGVYLIANVIVQTPQEPQVIYDKARNECRSEIWLVYDDFGPVIPQTAVKLPYPEKVTAITGQFVYGYGCSRDDALQVAKHQ